MIKEINVFGGELCYTSNFTRIEIYDEYADVVYPTVQHAYAACKTLNIEERIKISKEKTPLDAKRAGCKGGYITLREDWEEVKDSIMLELLRLKFCGKERYSSLLLSTHPNILVEGKLGHDSYWETCEDIGKNKIAPLLMRVRDEIVQENN